MEKTELEKNLPPLALLAACILGFYIRFSPVLAASFPLNDGALFVKMTGELLDANFKLPVFTNYNLLHIPYAYPPLGFYLAAFISRITYRWPLDIIRCLPPVISCLTIPAFYLAAKKLLKDPKSVALAVVIFALVPRSWLWLVMGGGLTRALGMLFVILTLYFGYQLFNDGKHALATSLCFALTVLSHPEAAVFAAILLGLLFLFYGRTKAGIRSLALVVGGAVLLTAPWWLTVILRHGFGPFLAASRTSGISSGFLHYLLFFDFTGETNLGLVSILALLGIAFRLVKREYFLPLLSVMAIILLQRSGPNYLMVPIALLAADGFTQFLLPGAKSMADKFASPQSLSLLEKLMSAYLLVSLLFSAFTAISQEDSPLQAIRPEDAQAMAWVRENTPADGKFVVIANAEWWEDYHGEWFPYLSERQAVNTLQGAEWLPGQTFNQMLTWRAAADACINQPAGCLGQNRSDYHIPFNYVYLVKQTALNPQTDTLALETILRQDADFRLVYENDAAAVFAWQP